MPEFLQYDGGKARYRGKSTETGPSENRRKSKIPAIRHHKIGQKLKIIGFLWAISHSKVEEIQEMHECLHYDVGKARFRGKSTAGVLLKIEEKM